MGRAGAGGYATVQHAYDTRLKRDVAIKCIKISASDIERARPQISIHDAQVINASRPLSDLRKAQGAVAGNAGVSGGRAGGSEGIVDADKASMSNGVLPWAPGELPTSGFVPLTAKISEPSFLDKNEERRANRARRHSLLREKRATANLAGESARSRVRAYGRVEPLGAKASEPDSPRGSVESDAISMDLSDFEGYTNFKRTNAGARGGRRAPKAMASTTIGLTQFAGNIPGMISGAGQANIAAIDDVVNVDVKTGDLSEGDSLTKDFRDLVKNGVKNGAIDKSAIGKAADMGASGVSGASGANIADADTGTGTADFADTALASAANATANAAANAAADARLKQSEEQLDLSKLDHIPGLEEARTAAHLNDANIVTVYDCVVEGDTCYVIMEYVEGKTLAKIMRELGNDITLDMIATVFTSVSHALEVAHKAGVLHLDVKPENVIVNSDGVVKVTDFGLSTLMDASGQGVTGGGTIGYMPLEQMRQQRLDVRTDEWALASLTYEMLSGKNPFKARNLREAEAAIEGAELVIPSLCWESIDESVDDVMFDALSPDMNGRYPDIESFSAELTPILGNAKEGGKQLAQAVKGPDVLPGHHDEAEKKRAERPSTPYVPLIDKLGMRGSSIIMRAFAALGTAMIAVISMMNFRVAFGGSGAASDGASAAQSIDVTFGLFSTFPIAAWIILAALVAFSAWRPRWAFPANIVVFFVMMVFNQAWIPAILLLAASGVWWWFLGRDNDMMCTLVMLQPLFGSVGFAAIVPVLSGALLDIRDALAASAMASFGALVWASLGSTDVMSWDIISNFIVALNPSIAGASISNGFLDTIASLQNWCIIAGWIAAAVLFSFMCRRGTHAFDILGSVIAAVLVIAGPLIVPIVTGNWDALTPLTISGMAVSSLLGIVFALLNVTDRVRLAPGEW